MKTHPQIHAAQAFSAQELALLDRFIRDQSGIVIRACRMELAQAAPAASPWCGLLARLLPWAENRRLRARLAAHERGIALQLLLERQLVEAQTYLHQPNEGNREQFVKGAFKALYACEAYAFGEKASWHIQQIINRLGLQIY